MWNISTKVRDTPYFFRRNRDLGTISVYVGYRDARCKYMVIIYIYPLINTPSPTQGVIISQPIFRFLGVIFDGDHDFEGPRSPTAHLDTVLMKPVTPPGHPPYSAKTDPEPKTLRGRPAGRHLRL